MLIITPSALTDTSTLSEFKAIARTSNSVIGILSNRGVCSFLIYDLREWMDSLLLILIVTTCCCVILPTESLRTTRQLSLISDILLFLNINAHSE